MKKAVSILLASLMILSFSGCSSNNGVTEKKVEEKKVSDNNYLLSTSYRIY